MIYPYKNDTKKIKEIGLTEIYKGRNKRRPINSQINILVNTGTNKICCLNKRRRRWIFFRRTSLKSECKICLIRDSGDSKGKGLSWRGLKYRNRVMRFGRGKTRSKIRFWRNCWRSKRLSCRNCPKRNKNYRKNEAYPLQNHKYNPASK